MGGIAALAQVSWERNGLPGGSEDLQEEGKPPGTFCLGKDLLIVPRIVVPQLIFLVKIPGGNVHLSINTLVP